MFGSEKYKNIDYMESTPKSISVGIAHFLKHISIAIWLNSLEYQFFGRDICPFLEKSTWNQPFALALKLDNLANVLTIYVNPLLPGVSMLTRE